jgi:hypothetical protein
VARFGSENTEAADEFRIDPVGLGASATALRKRLHLSGGHLAGCNTFRLKPCPELACLAASRFKADHGIPVQCKDRHGRMTCRSVWHPMAMPVGGAVNVKPVAADIYADNAVM